MNDAQRAEISKMIERQREVSASDRDAARESLMRSGLYKADGTLKPTYGGKKKSAA